MENNFDNRDFEQFVKQNADQYRMFPSEKVWKNIHHALHIRRRWYGLGLAVLLITAGLVTWVMLSPPSGNKEALSYKPAPVSQPSSNEQKNLDNPVLITVSNPADNKTGFISSNETLQKNVFNSGPENLVKDNSNDQVNTDTQQPKVEINKITDLSNPPVQVETPANHPALISKQMLTEKTEVNTIINPAQNNSPLIISDNKQSDLAITDKIPVAEKGDIYPLSIESVVNSYKHQRKGRNMSWEAYLTPTISYRKLTENKAFVNSAQSNNNIYNYYNSVSNINNLVRHKPDMGIQLGLNAGYPITRNMKIIAGLQFNVSKYDISVTYSSGDVATIALNTGGGVNSVSTISNYRNNSNGSKADWLRNYYFSASVPVGFELKLSGNNKTQVGVIGTVQPSYILSDRAYLLSTDYKNYAEVPSLTRKWNMSTSFEVFAGISTGKIDWRIGPQVRYQLKSSYVAKYPFKEHLFDFGLKMGIMLKK